MSSSRSARERALGVTELFEGILLFLPLRDVLLSQRVSKTWQANIQSSTPLQQKLFFDHEHTLPAPLEFYSDPAIYSDLLPWDLWAYKEEIYDAQPSEERTNMLQYIWHSPSASGIPITVDGNPVFSMLDNYLNISFKSRRPNPTIDLPQPWERPDASWRRMLLCHQPIQSTLEFWISDEHAGTLALFRLPISGSKQLRLGDIVNRLRQETPALQQVVARMIAAKSTHSFIYLGMKGLELWDTDEGGFVDDVSASDCDGKIHWLREN